MRPKKVILLFCDTIARYEETAFLLRVRGYRVEALETIGTKTKPDATLVVQNLHVGINDDYIRRAVISIRKCFETPILLVNGDGVTNADVDVTLSSKSSTADWLEQLYIMANRKRGLKKQIAQRESVAA